MNQLATIEELPVVQSSNAITPMQMLQMAVSQGADLDKLQKLMDLQERWEKNEARKAYQIAFAAFKAEAVSVIKNVTIIDGPLKGKKYADLFGVVDAATPMLSKHELTATWKITKDEKDWIEACCILTHVAGHSESTSFGGPPDSGGAKNAMQARASTLSYIQRYTFLSVTGLAAGGDDDGNQGKRDVGSGVDPERRKEIQEGVITPMKAHIKDGAIDDAVLTMENGGLDGADEWAFAWTFFDSKERSAMKKANERMKEERKNKPISEADKKRLEKMISNSEFDRDEIKAYCMKSYGKEHFAELNASEYNELCSKLETTNVEPPQSALESRPDAESSRAAGSAPSTEAGNTKVKSEPERVAEADASQPRQPIPASTQMTAEKAVENIGKAIDADTLALAADIAKAHCHSAPEKLAASQAYRKRLAELKAAATGASDES